MHEWEMQLEDYQIEHQWTDEKLTYIKLICNSEQLKSGKDKMDENAWEALLSEKYPQISFESNSISYSSNSQIVASGKLKIANSEKEVKIIGQLEESESLFTLKGSHPIQMEEYGIEAPTAMFGMMKVDPKVVLEFELQFTP